jgi:ABC-type dipeptide/oligopeptide/nickel transport system ATPase subunit
MTSIAEMLKLKLIMGTQTGNFDMFSTMAHVWQMIAISSIELCCNQIPILFNMCRSRFNKIAEQSSSAVLVVDQEKFISSIQFSHIYQTHNPTINIVDHIMWYITKLDHIRNLMVIIQEYFINDETITHIEDDVYFQLTRIDRSEDGAVSKLAFNLFSKKNSASYLRSFVDKCTQHYLLFQNNKFGDQTYYFDMLPSDIRGHNKVNLFIHQKFESFRSFENIFFTNQQNIMNRIETFMNNVEWYKTIGKPHTLGFLLYGSPGCGKTSFIKALSTRTQRHIINIKLDEIQTNKRFKQLFFDETILLQNDDPNDMTPLKECKIPLNKRIYVLEDIDCDDNSIVFKRGAIKPPVKPKVQREFDPFNKGGNYHPDDTKTAEKNDLLNLSTILNVLDGILEIPGRIIIATSNHPEKIDEAFLRPGRFDYTIEFTRATDEHIRAAIHKFSGGTYKIDPAVQFTPFKWSMAEIMQILWYNGDGDVNITKSVDIIINKDPTTEFKFRGMPLN